MLTSVTTCYTQLQKASVSQWSSIHIHPLISSNLSTRLVLPLEMSPGPWCREDSFNIRLWCRCCQQVLSYGCKFIRLPAFAAKSWMNKYIFESMYSTGQVSNAIVSCSWPTLSSWRLTCAIIILVASVIFVLVRFQKMKFCFSSRNNFCYGFS